MTTSTRQFAIAVFLLLAVTPAIAAVTYSPPVRSSQGDVLSCIAQNLSSESVSVMAELNNGLDTIVAQGTLSVPAGQSLTITSSTTAVFGAYCVFEFDADPGEVRGFIRLYDFGGSNTRLLYPASEADGRSMTEVETYTPPMRSSQGDVLSCVAQNLSDETVTVDAIIDNGLGAIVSSASLMIPAGRVLVVTSTTSAVFGAHCRFSFDANPSQVRGYIQLFDLGGSNTRLLLPATLIAAGRPSIAAQTYSAPLRSSDGDVLSCVVQNLSSAAVTVAAQIHNGAGGVVASGNISVGANRTLVVVNTTALVGGAYCSFTFNGNPSVVRTWLQLFDLGGSNTRLMMPSATTNEALDTFPPSNAGNAGVAALSGLGPVQLPPHSPPVRSSDGDVLSCVVQNLSAAAITADVTMDNGLNAVVASGQLVIQPGRVMVVASTTTQVFGASCQFLLSDPSPEVRGYIQLFDFGGSNTRLIYAASSPPLPTPPVTPMPTLSPTPTPMPTETLVDTPTATETLVDTPTATPEPTNTNTAAPSESPADATATPTTEETVQPTPTGGESPAPTLSPAATNTPDEPDATATPIVDASPTPSGLPEATDTPSDPESTATPGTTCVGDCNGDGTVSINELITMVNIALGNRPLDACPAGDRDDNGTISIAELIAAVNNALGGCA